VGFKPSRSAFWRLVAMASLLGALAKAEVSRGLSVSLDMMNR
jgi:hypothetical protein